MIREIIALWQLCEIMLQCCGVGLSFCFSKVFLYITLGAMSVLSLLKVIKETGALITAMMGVV